MAQKFASDQDAGDLLADILDETEADARAEAERLEARRKAKQQEEMLAKQQEEAQKNQEVSKRLEEERKRLEEVEKRRYDRLTETEIEQLKAEGRYEDPRALEKARAEEEARRKAEEEQRRKEDLARMEIEKAQLQEKMRQQAAEAEAKAAATQKTHKRNMIILGLVLALVLIAASTTAAIYTLQFSPDKTVYSKTNYKPQDVTLARVDVAFTPMPKPIYKEEEPEKTNKRKRRGAKGKSSPKKKAAKLDDFLNSGSDIF